MVTMNNMHVQPSRKLYSHSMKILGFFVVLLWVGCNPTAGGEKVATNEKAATPEKAEAAAAAEAAEEDSTVEVKGPEKAKEALVARAVSARNDGSFEECATLFEAAASNDLSSLASGYLYAAGCCAAQTGSKDGAFVHLNASAKRGFRAAPTLKHESVLTGLHDDPRWPKLVARIENNERTNLEAANAELATIFEQDQSERHGGYADLDWSKLGPRDAQRRMQVTEIIEAGGATTSEDYYHAAMVFQHGMKPEDFLRSHELAVKAVELDFMNGKAKWLAAASKDRYLMNTNQPQLYGTQYQAENGKWTLYEVDPSTTDKERAKWNVPSIAEARKQAEEMTKNNPPPPNFFESLRSMSPF
jgi:hypothetical protein